MLLGVIEISLRSTRVSAADVGTETSSRLLVREHAIAARQENIERLTSLLMAEVEMLRDLGASGIEVTASPELRGTRLIRLLDRVSSAVGSGSIRIPSRREIAAAAFLGATVAAEARDDEQVTVARVGEAGVEVASGTAGRVPGWFGSRPVGTTAIARKARFSNPPRQDQVEAALTGATRALGTLIAPPGERAIVVSSRAEQVANLCGPRIGLGEVRTGLESIRKLRTEDLAARFGIGPAEARGLIPAMVVHGALSEAFGQPVEPLAGDPVAGRRWLAEADRVFAGRRPG